MNDFPFDLSKLTKADLDRIEKVMAERRLIDFARLAWPYIEPGRMQINWHIECMADHLEAINKRQIKRLIINLPPRHMKSVLANVVWPAWTWAQDTGLDVEGNKLPLKPGEWVGPGTKFTFMSYQQDLSTRDSVKCRQLIDSPWFQFHFGDRVAFTPDQNQKTKFSNTANGFRLSLSFQGKITGEGADIFVIDDPHNIKNVESPVQREATLRTWDEVIPTRLNDPEHGVFLLIMQRTHERDLTGHILARETGWTHLVLPAEYDPVHPFKMKTPVVKTEGDGAGQPWKDPRQPGELLWKDRFTEPVIKEWKTRLGSYASAGQLQQRPAPREGGLFKGFWLKEQAAIPAGFDRVRAWDLAATEASAGMDPDWTVGVLMTVTREGIYYIEDIQRFRASPHQTKMNIVNQAMIDGKRTHIRIPQDPGQGGKYQAADMVKALAGFSVKAIPFSKNPGNKEARATPFAAQCEAGNVRYKKDAPWVRAFLDELTNFPNGQHDDIVDACSDAFASLALIKRKTVIAGGGY